MAQDILTTNSGDLQFKDGDLAVDTSNHQHVKHILLAYKGSYRQHPLVGIGIADYMNAPFTLFEKNALEKEIQLQLEADGAEADIDISKGMEIKIKGVKYDD